MRRDELYLRDIIEAADAIGGFISEVDVNSFVGNDLLRSATLQKLSIIGEASARLSSDLKSRYPDVEWRDIIGFRNIAIHAYFTVNWQVVRVTATVDVPDLRVRILRVLTADFPKSLANSRTNEEASNQSDSTT